MTPLSLGGGEGGWTLSMGPSPSDFLILSLQRNLQGMQPTEQHQVSASSLLGILNVKSTLYVCD